MGLRPHPSEPDPHGDDTVIAVGMTDRDAETALERFLEDVQGRAVRMAQVALHDREAALDVVQDAMTILVSRYRQRGSEAWTPLFWRILQSRIRDVYRRRRVRNSILSLFGGADPGSGKDALEDQADLRNPGPDDVLSHHRFAGDLQAALQELPLRQQQAFLLRHWEGLDTAATAAALGVSEGSVKTHLHRAIQALRVRLEKYR